MMLPTNNDESNDLYAVLGGVGLVGLVIAVLIAGGMRLAHEMGPRIGDIVCFDPTGPRSVETSAQITVLSADAVHSCVLDVGVIRASGGSLVIQSTQPEPNPSFGADWAGPLTSDGKTNCGASANLWLNQADIVALKLAAGGRY
jgi:hypothetical protein